MTTNKMWGGRFSEGPAAIMEEINTSIEFDKRLAAEDIAGSLAHVDMLAAKGIIAKTDARKIRKGLIAVRRELEAGFFPFRSEYEDIHLNIEARLTELIGASAGQLHTARSRNDQVATDLRLWVRAAIERADAGIGALQHALLAKAAKHTDTIMPGFTHMQPAQPVSFGHHCLAYVEMFARDRSRFSDASKRLNESPLGAAALAGTSYKIDRKMTAKALGFTTPMRNSLDAVSSRDFALEYLSAASICAAHLSRFAEEIVLWTSPAYGFVHLSDALSTGSSIMPQKRNPDAAELVRAKVGRILGAFTGLITVVKGLALAYAKDLQEDKEPVFASADALELGIAAMAAIVSDIKIDKKVMRAAAEKGYPTATDLADWIVTHVKKPFREAHQLAGQAVARAEKIGCPLDELSLKELQKIEPEITNSVYKVLSLDVSLNARTSLGGTAPARVKEQVKFWKERLK